MIAKKIDNWKLINSDLGLNADVLVPNDITKTLYDLGIVKEPYFGLNHKEIKKFVDMDYIYLTSFSFSRSDISSDEELFLSFNGIDTFADVYLNGKYLGNVENMFLQHVFNVTDLCVEGQNELKVVMHSTLKKMETIDTKDYFGIFNLPRILVRKEQCCFGWDWAPDIQGYGIWEDVVLFSENKNKITDVRYTADMNGEAVFFVDINYSVRTVYDYDGNLMEIKPSHEDYIRVSITKNPDGDFSNAIVKQVEVSGYQSFITFKRDDIELWWPNGYGKQPIYSYKVELVRDGKVISEKSGNFAYRTVTLEEKIAGDSKLNFAILINGKKIYAKGSNWVPIDCFTGAIEEDKYIKLINLAVKCNYNMFRVWGGGIYEKDIFYDVCDRLGIMVWQDFMFACSHIPDDNRAWVDNVTRECVYQVKRLCNHPSLVYWSGGNERVGSLTSKEAVGDWFVNVTLRGIVQNYDGTRPYAPSSPYSKNDIGNDLSSGDSHFSSLETCIEQSVDFYRESVAKNVVGFYSECAVMGPSVRQAYEKVFPQDKLWPMNEYWEDRLSDNPYAAYKLSFAKRLYKYATDLLGAPINLDDFICKGMIFHAELLRCEIEFSRAHKPFSAGFMNWMYSEIYPTTTWSVVDYFNEPKHAYYQMRKSFSTILMSFYLDNDGNTYLFGVNDSFDTVKVNYEFGLKNLDGNVLWKSEGNVSLNSDDSWKIKVEKQFELKNTYLYVKYNYGFGDIVNFYSYDLWKSCVFESDFEYSICPIDEYNAEITVKANKFTKSIFINFPNNCMVDYSDNYFDLEAGQSIKVKVVSNEIIDFNKIKITSFSNQK